MTRNEKVKKLEQKSSAKCTKVCKINEMDSLVIEYCVRKVLMAEILHPYFQWQGLDEYLEELIAKIK